MRVLFFLNLFFLSCSNYKLKVTSVPNQSDVYVYDNTSKKLVSVGKTPLDLDKKSLENLGLKFDDDFIILKVLNKGFVGENIIYDISTRKQSEAHLNLKKLEYWNDPQWEKSSHLANHIASQVQLINRKVNAKNFKDALSLAKSLAREYPKASIFYDTIGSIYVLTGDRNKGSLYYQKSLKLNPDNIDAKNALKSIKGDQQ